MNAPAPGFSKVSSTVVNRDILKTIEKIKEPSDQAKSPKIGNSGSNKTFKDCFVNPQSRVRKISFGQARSVKNLLDRPKFKSMRVLS